MGLISRSKRVSVTDLWESRISLSPRSWRSQIGAGFVSQEFLLNGTHPRIEEGFSHDFFQSRFMGVPHIAPAPILAVSDRSRFC